MNSLATIIRITSRALGRSGLVHAYGHCSARIDQDSFLVSPSMPLGLVKAQDHCPKVSITGELPENVLGEVRLHQQIYAKHREAGGVIRFMGPSLMALAALGKVPEMRNGFGTYFAPKVGFWNDVQLIRTDEKAQAAISSMGESAGLIMRGNGGVVFGDTLPEALGLAWYLEDACRVELAALISGLPNLPIISAQEASERATKSGRIFERMWDFLTHGDPELPAIAVEEKE